MLRLSFAHSGSALGSKTAHWLPLSIECSRKVNKRRIDTYFHSGSAGGARV